MTLATQLEARKISNGNFLSNAQNRSVHLPSDGDHLSELRNFVSKIQANGPAASQAAHSPEHGRLVSKLELRS
jgi:hypothetical protein